MAFCVDAAGQLTFSKPGSTEFGDNQLSLKDDSNAALVVVGGGSGGVGAHTVHLAHNHPSGHSFHPFSSPSHLTPLEIGMYVLLAVFCAAIAVFVGTCVVYASRARKSAALDEEPLPPTPPIRLDHLWNR